MFSIKAVLRNTIGSISSKKFRKFGKIPAIIYVKKSINIPILLNKEDISSIELLKNNIEILLEKRILKVKAKEIQKHPFKNYITHIDFIIL